MTEGELVAASFDCFSFTSHGLSARWSFSTFAKATVGLLFSSGTFSLGFGSILRFVVFMLFEAIGFGSGAGSGVFGEG